MHPLASSRMLAFLYQKCLILKEMPGQAINRFFWDKEGPQLSLQLFQQTYKKHNHSTSHDPRPQNSRMVKCCIRYSTRPQPPHKDYTRWLKICIRLPITFRSTRLSWMMTIILRKISASSMRMTWRTFSSRKKYMGSLHSRCRWRTALVSPTITRKLMMSSTRKRSTYQ